MRQFPDGANGNLTLDAVSQNPPTAANWDYTLTTPSGAILRDTEQSIGKAGTKESVALPGPGQETATFWARPLCDLGPGFDTPALGLPTIYAVSRMKNGAKEERVVGEEYVPKALPACESHKL